MGCDLHWILERQAPDGTWHAVLDEALAWDRLDAVDHPDLEARIAARRADPLLRIGRRDYALFGWLSRVRGPTLSRGALALPDFPLDASAYARQEARLWGTDWHTHGWVPPAILTTPAPALADQPDAIAHLGRWLADVAAAAAAADGAPALLPRQRAAGERWRPEDPAAPEGVRASAHARAHAALLGETLRGAPWRLLVAYDN